MATRRLGNHEFTGLVKQCIEVYFSDDEKILDPGKIRETLLSDTFKILECSFDDIIDAFVQLRRDGFLKAFAVHEGIRFQIA